MGCRLWPEGRFPGTSMREVLSWAWGEAPEGRCVPVLPERGPYADSVGRMTAILPELPLRWGVRTLEVFPGVTRFFRKARDVWEEDLDNVQECAEAGGVASSPVMVSVAGPLTVASHVELADGHWMLTDEGALRDVAAQYREAVPGLCAEVSRRTGGEVVVVVDETAAGPALWGTLPGVSEFEEVPVPEVSLLADYWGGIAEAVATMTAETMTVGAGTAGALSVVVRLPESAERWGGELVSAVSRGVVPAVPVPSPLTGARRDQLGEAVVQWGDCVLGVPPREWGRVSEKDSVVGSLVSVLRECGVAEVEVYDTAPLVELSVGDAVARLREGQRMPVLIAEMLAG